MRETLTSEEEAAAVALGGVLALLLVMCGYICCSNKHTALVFGFTLGASRPFYEKVIFAFGSQTNKQTTLKERKALESPNQLFAPKICITDFSYLRREK